MINPFLGWFFLERLKQRSVCYKGGGSNKIEETEAQRASSEIAIKNFNDYMQTIEPFQDKYIADVTGNYAGDESRLEGMTNADIAQKAGVVKANPNAAIPSMADVGSVTADALVKSRLKLGDQKAANFQSVIDIGMGKATTAQQGMTSLASQSAAEATNTATNNQNVTNSSMSAGASGIGVAAGLAKNLYSDSKKK